MLVYTHNYVLPGNINTTKDIVVFAGSTEYKVAVIQPDYQPHRRKTAKDAINNVLDIADKVIIYSIEVGFDVLVLMSLYDHPKVTFAICGDINFKLEHATVAPKLFWLTSTASAYKEISEFDTHSKPFVFEAMYGITKPHRQFVNLRVTASANEHVLQTPFLEEMTVKSSVVSPGEYWEDDIELIPGEDQHVMYNGARMFPSQVMPYKIYNQSAYSIVCETSADSRFSFFTEKIAKPLIAGRLFIIFSSKDYLKNLRKLGFKTFDEVIDESYDAIESDTMRWNMALAEVCKLIEQPQEEVLKRCLPIFEHNNNVIMSLPQHNNLEELLRP